MSKGSFVLAEQARLDLYAIAEYLLEKAGVVIAHAVLNELHRDFALLGLFPQLAPREPKLHKSVRIWTRHPYLIVYTDRTRPLRIIRILHGARDVHNLIDDGE